MAGLTAAFGFPYNSQFLLSAHNCCENGSRRVPSQSPHSPHVCSCHLEQVLQQKMNALPPGIFPRTSFGTGESNVLFGQSPREPSTVYPPLLRQCDVKDMNTGTFNAAWFVNPRYDQGFDRNSYLACHPFADRFSPIDLNSGARRKNATRETTSTLKAWLYEHRKNPYPTKGEKIMLAILTKMTLTQVSTWFANARRRLKKENKMTWSPRNRCGERKDSEGYSDDEEEEDEDQDEEETKNEELSEERTQNMCRKTTVIKTPEDAKSIYHADSARAKIMGNGDSFNQDQQMRNARDVVPPTRTDQRIIWPNPRSPAETEKTCPTNGSSIEDSPVKSLRKWVDGCFDQNRENSSAPVTDTPPLTPPNESERLTETVTQLAESEEQTARQKSSSSRVMSEINHADEAEERLTEHSNAETTNREIDAALALTTLFSRS